MSLSYIYTFMITVDIRSNKRPHRKGIVR